jgi:hypothetical protein
MVKVEKKKVKYVVQPSLVRAVLFIRVVRVERACRLPFAQRRRRWWRQCNR